MNQSEYSPNKGIIMGRFGQTCIHHYSMVLVKGHVYLSPDFPLGTSHYSLGWLKQLQGKIWAEIHNLFPRTVL